MDKNENRGIWGNNIRIKVKLDISRPLKRGFMLNMEGTDKKFWITFRYERIPNFCFNCGRIGHVVKECPGIKNKEDMDRNNFEFGLWLKFQGFSSPSKPPEGSRKQEDKAEHEDLVKNINKETGDRNKKRIDVDLNLESPIEEDAELGLNGRKEIDILELMEESDETIRERCTWNVNQNENSESKKEGDGREIDKEDLPIEEASEVSFPILRRKSSWKRKVRCSQKDKLPMDEKGIRKRKGGSLEENDNKKLRGCETEKLEMGDGSQILAVAGKQPCQSL